MRAIGGYFELELRNFGDNFPHSQCPAFNSGRHALEYIFRQLDKQIKKVYIPYYTCDVILEPLRRLNIGYKFYHIDNNLEITNIPKLSENEYLIVNNYFGIKDSYIESLFQKLGDRLIVDNAQAFYAPEHPGLKSIYSPRKFVGVPDGGFAFTAIRTNLSFENDFSTDRSCFLLRRIDKDAQSGYKEFKDSSHSLSNSPIRKMSLLTRRLLESIDFSEIQKIRRRNFEFLHNELRLTNKLNIPDIATFKCPMVYPFRCSDKSLRSRLINKQIFVATYWPNIKDWCNKNDTEYQLMNEIIPLPIDQRYNIEDMKRIINVIKE